MESGNDGCLPRTARRTGLGEDMSAFFSCAEMFMPWLNSSEVASISCTCKFLREMSKSLTEIRSSDASRSMEKHPICFINTQDHRPYADFIYSPSQIVISSNSSKFERHFWDFNSVIGKKSGNSPDRGNIDCTFGELGGNFDRTCGCDCDSCDEVVDGGCLCPCYSFNQSGLVTECGLACRCGSDCSNRLTQRGVSVRLKIVRDSRKGWGLHTDEKISQGKFICEYAGELITTKEARNRQEKYDKFASMGRHCPRALLVVREYMPSGRSCIRLNVDATYIGNIARFINHSCDGGNLSCVVVRNIGAFIPRICLFSSRDIGRDEELTFCYGSPQLRTSSSAPELRCFCGSSCCKGVLPSEDT